MTQYNTQDLVSLAQVASMLNEVNMTSNIAKTEELIGHILNAKIDAIAPRSSDGCATMPAEDLGKGEPEHGVQPNDSYATRLSALNQIASENHTTIGDIKALAKHLGLSAYMLVR